MLCHIFHCHAVVVCRDRYWCTFDIDEDMSIGAILDVCDLHFIYLCPGIFVELKLKRKHGTLSSFSPPEFPEWTFQGDSYSEDRALLDSMTNISEPSTCDDNALLHAFLNINDTTDSNIPGGNQDKNAAPPSASDNHSQGIADINSCNSQDIGTNHSIDLNITIGYEVTLNPCSLKETCLQCLSSNVRSLKPPSFFKLSIDYMAWNSTKRFNCSMSLPKSTFTINTAIELIWQ